MNLNKNLDINDIDKVLECFFNNYNEPFNCEATFQFNLAMFIKEYCKNVDKIVFEENIYKNPKSRCDLVVYLDNGDRIFIELKYVVVGCKIKNGKLKKIATPSGGARRSFVTDCVRLKKDLVECNNNDKKYCIFVSNKSAVVETGEESVYPCHIFFNNNFKFNKAEKNDKKIKCLVRDIKHWKLEPTKKHEEIVKYLLVEIKTEDEIEDLCQESSVCDKKRCKNFLQRPKLT